MPLKKYFSKPYGGVVIEDGVVITFERSKSNTKIAKKSIARKKKGDTILHQIASRGESGMARKYCRNQQDARRGKRG